MKEISVFIIDDHPVIRHGVSAVLGKNDDMRVLGDAQDGESAIKMLKKLSPDVIVLDITMEGISGIDLIPQLYGQQLKCSIVIYSAHKQPDFVHRAIKAGAKGYVLKSDPIEELITAIRGVYNKHPYLSSGLPPEILEQMLTGKDSGDALAALSPREYEVANLLVQGMNPTEVGKTLSISPKTARVHRVNIMRKLGCGQVNELLLTLVKHFPH